MLDITKSFLVLMHLASWWHISEKIL